LSEREYTSFMSGGALPSVLLAINPAGQGDLTETGVLWRYQRSLPTVPSPIVYRGALYLLKEGGILAALDAATGALLKQVRLRGALDNYFVSPVAADGKLYLTSQAGHIVVVRAQGDLKILAVNDLDEECFATPAVAPGRLYIRTRSALWCFGESARARADGGGRGYHRFVNSPTQ
jgi:outer membrane protein assembly factor BamB